MGKPSAECSATSQGLLQRVSQLCLLYRSRNLRPATLRALRYKASARTTFSWSRDGGNLNRRRDS